MGGIMARAGCDNDELIDVLVEESYIKSSAIEKVFRMVDRAEYFLPHHRGNAYNGLAWKSYHFHLSAPCVYSTVMEGLRLKPGLSFLNLGSGTGYLSTMVGLMLGNNGLNHGIEYYADVVEYANAKLEDFRRYSGAIDEFDYCEPKFKQGNVLCLSTDFHAQYDRVYCGAAVPVEYESYMKNLLRIGGILVMPVDDKLLQVRRLSATQWEQESLLPVTFAVLIQPTTTTATPKDQDATVQMFDIEPMSLQARCRCVIRSILRKSIEAEEPMLKKSQKAWPPPVAKKKRAVRRLVVPLFDSDEDTSDEERHVTLDLERHRRPIAELREEGDNLYNLVLGTFQEADSRLEDDREWSNDEDVEMELEGEDHYERRFIRRRTRAVIERDPSQDNERNNRDNERNSTTDDDNHDDDDNDDPPREGSRPVNDVLIDLYNVLRDTVEDHVIDESDSNGEESCGVKKSSSFEDLCNNYRKKKRDEDEDEIVSQSSDSSDDDNGASSSDGDADQRTKRHKRDPKKNNKKAPKWLRLDSSETQKGGGESSSSGGGGVGNNDDSANVEEEEEEVEEEEEEEEAQEEEEDDMRMYISPYTYLMMAKIQQLPLPPMLKKYLSFYRGC